MKLQEFKARMLGYALGQAKLLAEMSALEDKKVEPEQLRANVVSILAILVETEEFIQSLESSSSSDTSIVN